MRSRRPIKPGKEIRRELAAILTVILSPVIGFAQQPCTSGVRVEGTITDPAGALVAGAEVQAANSAKTTSDTAGRFLLPCIPTSSKTITVQAEGFAPNTASVNRQAGESVRIDLRLSIAQIQTEVQVSSDAATIDAEGGGDTTTLNTQDVQQLADDPDDLLRQIQVLAAAAGGDPTASVIQVDGFQNTSALPPKGSIASIRINPDLFSSEYSFPPFSGGLIEITTKPGADSFHGALFFTDSDGSFNATDPFSVTATPAGKRRYGFELSGPIMPKKSGFALALEKRDIDEFSVVNATTLDENNNPAPFQQTVAAPQRLWIASARADWQITPKDVGVLSFSSNVNNLGNMGVGGLTLTEAGYSALVDEYDLRLNNTQTINANLLHETHIGYSWKRTRQTPNSTAPSLQVAGSFTRGGATSQNLNNRERDLETDDDVLFTHGKHELKIGVQSLGIFVHDYDPDTFNGAYVFGGGSAPVLDASNHPTDQTITLTPIQQYQRALHNLPGGSPTTYQVTRGTPLIPLTQWRFSLYAQDSIKLAQRLTMTTGLRYQFQTTPDSFANFGPRLGFAWSADKKETWVFHLRAGLFENSPSTPSYATEVYRLNGIRQTQVTVYSPSYSEPLTPVEGSIQVSTIKQFPHSLAQQSTFVAYFNAEHDFPHHWHARGNLYWGEDWNTVRIRNINAPIVPSSIGAAPDPTAALLASRPITPGENILQYENSGHLAGNVISFSMDQHSYKRFGLYTRYAHMNFKSDAGTNPTPQSSYSNLGESARVEWRRSNSISLLGNVTLPYGIEWMTQFDASAGAPYNITTGTDNNGDGTFNDRPAYAPASTSPSASGVYPTRFGLLTTNTINGNVPRNLGTMPGLIHLDMNLSRGFQLNPGDKDHPRTITFNARSANVLNHTNVTAVQTVLSSTLGQSISAETARRLELGVRFAF